MKFLGKISRFLEELKSLFFMVDFRTFSRYCWLILVNLPAIIRLSYLGVASEKMTGRNYTFKVFGSINLEGKYFGRATELYARGVYFILPEFRIKKDMTVIDLGANIGAFTILAGLIAKKVIAVEAVASILEELKDNARQNHCLNKIEPVWGIVGPHSGMMAQPAVLKETYGNIDPPILIFGDLLKKFNIEKVDFLKIDIEGSEFDLFKGDLDWLSKVGLIAMEVHAPFVSSGVIVSTGDINELRKTLEKSGFKVWLFDLNKKPVQEIKGPAGYLYAKNLNLS
jgi:FkbM family methyltransferase